MFWLPPVRFSTMTGCDQAAWSAGDSTRAMVSGEPPGGSGTTILIGRSGKPCAAATEVAAASAMNAANRRMAAAYRGPVIVQESFQIQEEEPIHADPGRTGEARTRRKPFPVADPGAGLVERRVHAIAAVRAAEGIRGASQGDRRAAGEEAQHDAPEVLQDRRRHGGRVRGDE